MSDDDVPPLPPDAEVFPAENLAGSMRGEKFVAQLTALIPAGIFILTLYLLATNIREAASGADYLGLLLGGAAGFGITYGLTRQVKKLIDGHDALIALAEKYQHRAIVLTPEYFEVTIAALSEHARVPYALKGLKFLRLPWSDIHEFYRDRLKSGPNGGYDDYYLIKAKGLPKHFSGRLEVHAGRFKAVDQALREAVDRRRGISR